MVLQKIERLDQLIRLEATGSPSELARKTGMSERMIYKYLDYMKTSLNAPIEYSRDKKTYRYAESGVIHFKWEKKQQ
jgi:predicted DNA-binding transcriptional regulator YafY